MGRFEGVLAGTGTLMLVGGRRRGWCVTENTLTSSALAFHQEVAEAPGAGEELRADAAEAGGRLMLRGGSGSQGGNDR